MRSTVTSKPIDWLRKVPRCSAARGDLLMEGGKLSEAETAFREAIQFDPCVTSKPSTTWESPRRSPVGRAIRRGTRRTFVKRSPCSLDSFWRTTAWATPCWSKASGGRPRTTSSTHFRLKSDYPDAHNSLGYALMKQGNQEEALACFDEALRLNPNYAEAINNRASALQARGKLEEALARLPQSTAGSKPDVAKTHTNLGAAPGGHGKHRRGDGELRGGSFVSDQNHADAYNNRGCVLLKQGQLREAARQLRSGTSPQARTMPRAIITGGRHCTDSVNWMRPTVSAYDRVLELAPDLADAHNSRGRALMALNKHAEALDCFRESIRLKPSQAVAQFLQGDALLQLGKLDEASASFEEALRLEPNFAAAVDGRCHALYSKGELDEMLAWCEKLERLYPDLAELHANRGMALLLKGDFDQGWPEYEWRMRSVEWAAAVPTLPIPLWDGGLLRGKTILLRSEQGFGDTLQFIRFAALVKARGGNVLFECAQPLWRVLSDVSGVDQLVEIGARPPGVDVLSHLLSLPGLLGTTPASIPARIPYLHADPELVAAWQEELAPYRGLKIGITWQGNPAFKGDRRRSFPLERFAPVARLEGVQLFSLQKGFGSEQLEQLEQPCPIENLGPRLNDFMDTAALIKNLDLVIAPDTAVAHLAGALGVPVWMAVPFTPDWRWMLGRTDSPWYPTMRLFRQSAPGDWHGVFWVDRH